MMEIVALACILGSPLWLLLVFWLTGQMEGDAKWKDHDPKA